GRKGGFDLMQTVLQRSLRRAHGLLSLTGGASLQRPAWVARSRSMDAGSLCASSNARICGSDLVVYGRANEMIRDGTDPGSLCCGHKVAGVSPEKPTFPTIRTAP